MPLAGTQQNSLAPRSGSGDAGRRLRGLLIDWGGVMTASLAASFIRICEEEGLEARALRQVVRDQPQAGGLLAEFEQGRISEREFESRLGALIGLVRTDGLIDRILASVPVDERMVQAVRAARQAGIATGLVSNSLGTTHYPRGLLAEIFDAVVISGEIGIRKPDPRIYELAARSIGREPHECVFVDDLAVNLEPARALGMQVVHHTSGEATIAALERLFGVPLGQSVAGTTRGG
jgi:epoxide hydrolase-like predicted phosphatase